MVKNWKKTLMSLGLGQLLSILITLAGFTSSKLAKQGIYAPSSQCFLNYVLLALFNGGIMLYRRKPFKAELYYCILPALLDVFGKTFVIEAYQYASLTSIMLLDCWTIPCVVVFTCLFRKTKYGLQKFVGVAICVVGLAIVILSDVHSANWSTGSKLLRGDLLIIIGATFYGISNVYEELLFEKADRVELMALLGFYGAILTAPRMVLFERHRLKFILSSSEAILPFIGFPLALFLFYSGFSLFLKISGSTMLNLSLLTFNIWVILIRIFAYHEKVDWIYFVAFATVILGFIVYLRGDEIDPNNGETLSIDEEANLGHPDTDNAGVSNKDEVRILFQGARNSLCCITPRARCERVMP